MSHLGNVLNKAQLFDDSLASHPVSIAKAIPVLVDFVAKMEELLDNMRSLFDDIGPRPIQGVELENVLDLSLETGDIPSLTGWRREPESTSIPTKPAQSKTSKRQQRKSLWIN